MYDHGFRLDQEHYEPDVRHMPFLWGMLRVAAFFWPPDPYQFFRWLVFPYMESDDGVIMECTRKFLGRLELSYIHYMGKEIFYIGWNDKELFRKEKDVRRDQGLSKDIPY